MTHFYATWEEAADATRALGIDRIGQYKAEHGKDPRLPPNPRTFYGDVWVKNMGWPGFFGRPYSYAFRKMPPYATWEEASQAARELGIMARDDFTFNDYYEAYGAKRERDPRLPGNPVGCYPEWQKRGGWRGFLGLEPVYYPTWEEAAEAARRLGITRKSDYWKRYDLDPKLPMSPEFCYRDVFNLRGGWPGFLGRPCLRKREYARRLPSNARHDAS